MVWQSGLEDGGLSCSSWWREIVRIRDGVGEGGEGWFADCVRRRVGDGVDTVFGEIVGVVVFRCVSALGDFMT